MYGSLVVLALICHGIRYLFERIKGEGKNAGRYAVIYWEDDKVYPCMNDDRTLQLFERIEDADKFAEEFEYSYGCETRVITIDGVAE